MVFEINKGNEEKKHSDSDDVLINVNIEQLKLLTIGEIKKLTNDYFLKGGVKNETKKDIS